LGTLRRAGFTTAYASPEIRFRAGRSHFVVASKGALHPHGAVVPLRAWSDGRRSTIGVRRDFMIPGSSNVLRAVSVHFTLPEMAKHCPNPKVHPECTLPLKISWMKAVARACAGADRCVVGGDFNSNGIVPLTSAGFVELAHESRSGGAAHLLMKRSAELTRVNSHVAGTFGSDHQLMAAVVDTHSR
jgi:hypothetical protein